ncbi:unnamed protein product [Brassica napus]|uniref:(rape) hypothetical protein n=1 Tax=Brassica napus TaxID=3708 RepID=A0A816P1X2_BRANA|nr:unnamed protein product [Brassica napus]
MENRRGGDDTVVTGGEAEIACEGEAAQDKHGGEGKGQPEYVLITWREGYKSKQRRHHLQCPPSLSEEWRRRGLRIVILRLLILMKMELLELRSLYCITERDGED